MWWAYLRDHASLGLIDMVFLQGDTTTARVRYEQAINMLNWITFRVMEDLVYDDSLALYK